MPPTSSRFRALAELGKDLDAQLAGEALHPRVVGADPLAAEVDLDPVAERGVEQPPADPLAGLEHDHLAAGVGQRPRGAQAGEPGADDRDVGAQRRAAQPWIFSPRSSIATNFRSRRSRVSGFFASCRR